MKAQFTFKGKEESIEVPAEPTLKVIKEAISKKINLNVNRLKLSKKVDKKEEPLAKSDSEVISKEDLSLIKVKDLGLQISWRLVFFLEYIGPLFIHAIWAGFMWNKLGLIQKIAAACIVGHYFKREVETFFVHRFSHETMPLLKLFKNCAHYWGLGGVFVAYQLYSPSFRAPINVLSNRLQLNVAIFVFAELANGYVHIKLRNLRPAGTAVRKIPRGFGFDDVSCPNYMFESISWFVLSSITRCKALMIFTAVATLQMYFWARKKHTRYLQEFPNYPKNRTSMFPILP